MFMTPPPDPILGRFRAALAETYGDRLERPILFGSRARGDARCAEAPERVDAYPDHHEASSP